MPDARPVTVADERLKRVSAGRYVTPDRRFTVERQGTAWYVRDAKQLDELGLPRLVGPLPTLEDVRTAIAAARDQASSRSPGTARGS